MNFITIFVKNRVLRKQYTIKEIAAVAGVSPGTVDRVLHGRGKVSKNNLEKINKVLDEVGYKFNLHTSAVALKKGFTLVVCIPESSTGEYWSILQKGIARALDEYCDIEVQCHKIFYDQFNISSYISATATIEKFSPDAVILGPTFHEHTKTVCEQLDKKKIPYAFVDADITDANPIASFTAHQSTGGTILAKLMCESAKGEIAVFMPEIKGGESLGVERRSEAFAEYVKEHAGTIRKCVFSTSDINANEELIKAFLRKYPDVRSIGVMNSRGYIIADALNSLGIKDISVYGFDLTYNNQRCIKNGTISMVLNQRPQNQGFLAMQACLRYLMYRKKEETSFISMPIDIILKENLPFYSEAFEM